MSVWPSNAFVLLFIGVLVSCRGACRGGENPSTGGVPTQGGATPGTGGSPGTGRGNVAAPAIDGSIAVSPSNKIEVVDNASSNNETLASAQPIAAGDSLAGSVAVSDAGTDFTAPFAFRIRDFNRVTITEPATIVLTWEICEIEDARGEFPDEIDYTSSTLWNRNYSVGHFRLAKPGPIPGPVAARSR